MQVDGTSTSVRFLDTATPTAGADEDMGTREANLACRLAARGGPESALRGADVGQFAIANSEDGHFTDELSSIINPRESDCLLTFHISPHIFLLALYYTVDIVNDKVSLAVTSTCFGLCWVSCIGPSLGAKDEVEKRIMSELMASQHRGDAGITTAFIRQKIWQRSIDAPGAAHSSLVCTLSPKLLINQCLSWVYIVVLLCAEWVFLHMYKSTIFISP